MKSKTDLVIDYLISRQKCGNQPQIFSSPMVHKATGICRGNMGGSMVDKIIGKLRKQGVIEDVGTVGTEHFYKIQNRTTHYKFYPVSKEDWKAKINLTKKEL